MRVLYMWRVAPLVTAIALTWLFLAGIAQAQTSGGTTLQLTLPIEGAVGEELIVTARLTSQVGFPVSGAEVVFRRDTEFMNASSELEMGRALTDGQGTATLTFLPRSEGELLIFADFEGDVQYASSFAEGTTFIQTGPALYMEEAGIKVPGMNISLLVGILSIVWGTYFIVMFRIWLIAREGASLSTTVEVSRD